MYVCIVSEFTLLYLGVKCRIIVTQTCIGYCCQTWKMWTVYSVNEKEKTMLYSFIPIISKTNRLPFLLTKSCLSLQHPIFKEICLFPGNWTGFVDLLYFFSFIIFCLTYKVWRNADLCALTKFRVFTEWIIKTFWFMYLHLIWQ